MYIHQVGMSSCLGHHAAIACAAARCGISILRDIPCIDMDAESAEINRITGHVAPLIGGTAAFARLALLSIHGLHSLLHEYPVSDETKIHCAILLPEVFFRPELDECVDAFEQDAISLFTQALENGLQVYPIGHFASLHCVQGNEGQFIELLQYAQQLLENDPDCRVVIGAVDSLVEAQTADWLNSMGRVRSSSQSDGTRLGEGAAFFLLGASAPQNDDRTAKVPTIHIASACIEQESYEYFPQPDEDEDDTSTMSTPSLDGYAYVRSMYQTLQASEHLSVGLVIHDLTGEAFKAREWGSAWVQLLKHYPELDDVQTITPVESFGYVGTAMMAFCMVMGFQALLYDCTNNGAVLCAVAADENTRMSLLMCLEESKEIAHV